MFNWQIHRRLIPSLGESPHSFSAVLSSNMAYIQIKDKYGIQRTVHCIDENFQSYDKHLLFTNAWAKS